MIPGDRDRDVLPVVPKLSVRENRATPDPTPAAQGPAPADLSEREAPNVPPPAEAGLSAAEVTTLAGGDASMSEANRALAAAEGLNPDTES